VLGGISPAAQKEEEEAVSFVNILIFYTMLNMY
jgi:hypothetical protein